MDKMSKISVELKPMDPMYYLKNMPIDELSIYAFSIIVMLSKKNAPECANLKQRLFQLEELVSSFNQSVSDEWIKKKGDKVGNDEIEERGRKY